MEAGRETGRVGQQLVILNIQADAGVKEVRFTSIKGCSQIKIDLSTDSFCPDTETLYIGSDVTNIRIKNNMFPKVTKVVLTVNIFCQEMFR